MNILTRAIPIVLLAFAAPAMSADVYDHIFVYGTDIPSDAPTNTSAAARFLTQATFGPTQIDITRLMALGYGEWIAEQFAMPPTLGEATVEAVVDARTAGVQTVSQTQRLNRWLWQAAYAPDQLRQRMAWALSEIFVVSDQSSMISGDIVPMTAYNDLLLTNAFSTYRTLLGAVTVNPTMGKYLNAYHNVKTSATTSPDENYAREVMQLFSVGLVELNMDHSTVLVNNEPVPTYTQTTITNTAKVFTGFTFSDATQGSGPPLYMGANFFTGGVTFAAQYAPMACWGTELYPATGTGSGNMRHDITGDDGTTNTSKTVLGGLTIAPNQTCATDVKDELDIVAAHANVAPFISRQLIQRFVSSNPSPAYITRVANIFESSGGDLSLVLQAILTDTEAKTPPPPQNIASYGKLREPLLRLTAMWRAFNAVAPAPDKYGEVSMVGGTNFLGSLGQGPLESPTVFNFFTPDYQQPGTLASSGLFSPEFQITNESTTYTTADAFYNFTARAYLGIASPPTDRPLIDLSSLTANINNPSAMVATINNNMLYGSMSNTLQSVLLNVVYELTDGAQPSETAWSLIYLTMLSPEYAAQL